jgi:hypothetical protein
MKASISNLLYARSHHYYYDLDGLQRIGTISYVEDPNYISTDNLPKEHFND